ncbi:Sex peptide receptor [Amphibalanus amphitrite]|uniref:Sex peptide receptor n=1 Tax=Amphibalanus amphitrite TaxID=1232801 RepID=A0A6A4XC78_AMPAM|nr:G-protein coupled receptor dmsr-1-like [Amphibalanus amphitrite]KAF0313930.1 Sex peptide receptor [Amphibalanus amphitrite]
MALNSVVTSNAKRYLETMLRDLNFTLDDWAIYRELTGQSGELGGLSDQLWAVDTGDEDERAICGERGQWLRDSYRPWHGYLALFVCLFGSVANLFNIAVLTRKEMRSPTNVILTGLAVADLMVMVEYIPFAYRRHISTIKDTFSYPDTLYILFHAHFAQVFHTISIWMTVMLAVWRFLSIVHMHTASRCCSMRNSICCIVATYVLTPIICIPSYFTFSLRGHPTPSGQVLYRIDISSLGRAHGGLLSRVNFWLFAVAIKLVPCLALTYFSVRLIGVLLETKRRKQRLLSGCQPAGEHHPLARGSRQADRTTWMLVTVLLLFLITEFPQGILALLSGILQDRFFRSCYLHVGELLDMLALINSAVNFLLYCLMNKQFRVEFRALMSLPARPCRRRRTHTVNKLRQACVTDTTCV